MFQQGDCQEVLHTFRRLSKTVIQLFPDIIRLGDSLNLRYPFIDIQFLKLIFNILHRDKCVNPNINRSFIFLLRNLRTSQPFYRCIEHFAVEIIANRCHVSVLAGT